MKRLLKYISLYRTVRWPFFAAVLCGLVAGVASGFGLPLILDVVLPDLFSDDGGAAREPTVFSRLWSEIWPFGADRVQGSAPAAEGTAATGGEIALKVMVIPLIFAVRGLGIFFNAYLITYCGVRILEEFRKRIFDRLLSLHLGFFKSHNTGDILSRVVNDTIQVMFCLTRVSNDIIVQPFTFLGAMGYLVYAVIQNNDVMFVLFYFAFIPACVFPIRYVGKKLQKRSAQLMAQMGGLTEFIRENVEGVREVQSYNLQGNRHAKFEDIVRYYVGIQLKVAKYNKLLVPIIEFVSAVGIAMAIAYASQTDIGLGQITAIIAAFYFAYDPLKKLGNVHNEIQRGIASLDRMEEILDTQAEIRDAENAVALKDVSGRIEFQSVDFRYGDTPVLRGVDCDLESGKIYAIVGASGAGKTTFINLISRFYDVASGRILLDGRDIRDVRLQDLRANISLVPQEPMLFNDTIEENIRLGRPESTDEEVRNAAMRAYAEGFIGQLDEGYRTVVGEKGLRLSGGQKQRIALARAFLKDAPILVLDEATSALDSVSETEVQKSLNAFRHGRTVLIIAHRFSTLEIADRILVFDQGNLAAQGRHEDLYPNCQEYATLIDRQFRAKAGQRRSE